MNPDLSAAFLYDKDAVAGSSPAKMHPKRYPEGKNDGVYPIGCTPASFEWSAASRKVAGRAEISSQECVRETMQVAFGDGEDSVMDEEEFLELCEKASKRSNNESHGASNSTFSDLFGSFTDFILKDKKECQMVRAELGRVRGESDAKKYVLNQPECHRWDACLPSAVHSPIRSPGRNSNQKLDSKCVLRPGLERVKEEDSSGKKEEQLTSKEMQSGKWRGDNACSKQSINEFEQEKSRKSEAGGFIRNQDGFDDEIVTGNRQQSPSCGPSRQIMASPKASSSPLHSATRGRCPFRAYGYTQPSRSKEDNQDKKMAGQKKTSTSSHMKCKPRGGTTCFSKANRSYSFDDLSDLSSSEHSSRDDDRFNNKAGGLNTITTESTFQKIFERKRASDSAPKVPARRRSPGRRRLYSN